MRCSIASNRRVVIAETVHPMYRSVLRTYTDAVAIDVVVVPALQLAGLDRLGGLCESFLTYVENRTLPGGCFFAAAAAELGGRPGPLRERVAANQKDWISVLTQAADEAVARDELHADTDVATLVFELNALVIAANTAYILHDDPAVLTQARTAISRVIASARCG